MLPGSQPFSGSCRKKARETGCGKGAEGADVRTDFLGLFWKSAARCPNKYDSLNYKRTDLIRDLASYLQMRFEWLSRKNIIQTILPQRGTGCFFSLLFSQFPINRPACLETPDSRFYRSLCRTFSSEKVALLFHRGRPAAGVLPDLSFFSFIRRELLRSPGFLFLLFKILTRSDLVGLLLLSS